MAWFTWTPKTIFTARKISASPSRGRRRPSFVKGVADPAAHFRGKTIRVRSEVLIFEKLPYLPVTDPGQIEIIGHEK